MPLLSGPMLLPVDLRYLDRYCYLVGDDYGGVILGCEKCATADYAVAYLGRAEYAPANTTVVQDIASLIDAGMRHLAEYHPEP